MQPIAIHVTGSGNTVTVAMSTPRTAPALPASWWVLVRRALAWLMGAMA